jgi:hypothetical protein
LRRVAVIKPYGLEQSLAVSELLPCNSHSLDADRQLVSNYERALDAFLHGSWQQAHKFLQQAPSTDRVKAFLAGYMAQHGGPAPATWNGVIAMTSK